MKENTAVAVVRGWNAGDAGAAAGRRDNLTRHGEDLLLRPRRLQLNAAGDD